MSKLPLEIDMIAATQTRDIQGELLNIEGADISELEAGKGMFNDNHQAGFFNSIGRVTSAKKIMVEGDCEDERQKYYWDKVKAPYIYVKGLLYDDEDHPNARAAAAILRNIHKSDIPLKLKASVEGATIARGMKDPTLLARTKIVKVALTFTPANSATLVEPTSLDKSAGHSQEADYELIRSVMHLAKTDVPSFRHIERHASANKIMQKLSVLDDMASQLGLEPFSEQVSSEQLIKVALESKIMNNVKKINELSKALTAGYGGAAAPASRTYGAVIQSEAVEPGFKYISCEKCGKEQPYLKHQVKCRSCNQSLSFEKLKPYIKK